MTSGLIAVMAVLVVMGYPIVSGLIVLVTAIWVALDSAYLKMRDYNVRVGHPVWVFIAMLVLGMSHFTLYVVTGNMPVARSGLPFLWTISFLRDSLDARRFDSATLTFLWTMYLLMYLLCFLWAIYFLLYLVMRSRRVAGELKLKMAHGATLTSRPI